MYTPLCCYCGFPKPEVKKTGDICNPCVDEAEKDPTFDFDIPEDGEWTQDDHDMYYSGTAEL